MNYEVVKIVDQFNEKTTIKMNEKFYLSRTSHDDMGMLIRYLSMPDIDSFFIDYYHNGRYKDYPEGDLIIRINDMTNIKLPFRGYDSTYIDNWAYEYNFVELDKSSLETICEASDIEIKINGDCPQVYNKSQCRGFIEYCKFFYNEFYNEQKYVIEKVLLNNQEPTQQEKASISEKAIEVILGLGFVVLIVLILCLIYITKF